MVCDHCVRIVREELEKTGDIQVNKIGLGSASIAYNSQKIDLEDIKRILKENGFSLLLKPEERLIEKIKIAVIELIYHAANTHALIRNNSDYLQDKLATSYSHLSKLFSDKEGMTLEKYIISVKIEKVKEMLSYNEMTLSEIAYQMGYSSVQYLSNQFRQVVGISVSQYKRMKFKTRLPLDALTDKNLQLTEQIKITVIELISNMCKTNALMKTTDHLSEKIGIPFTTICEVFYEQEKTTLEHYVAIQKIEKVKDLIKQENLTLSEIALELGYNSVHELKENFRVVSGHSVDDFKKI